MALATSRLEGGFADPVFAAQAVFRAVMDAMARPGTTANLGAQVEPPAPLGQAAGAVALALCDSDTPVWLDAGLANAADVSTWLAFHSGATVVDAAPRAQFAFISDASAMPLLAAFAQGTQNYPDRSATLVIEVESLAGGNEFAFEGPGIKGVATLAPAGLPGDFAMQWRDNRARFPRGVDLILTAGDTIACLPRSARLIGTGTL